MSMGTADGGTSAPVPVGGARPVVISMETQANTRPAQAPSPPSILSIEEFLLFPATGDGCWEPAMITLGLISCPVWNMVANVTVWFTGWTRNSIGGLMPDLTPTSGLLLEFRLPTPASQPWDIEYDEVSHCLWFTEYGTNRVGRLCMVGTTWYLTEWQMENCSGPHGLALQHIDQNMTLVWFTEYRAGKICCLDPSANVVWKFYIETEGLRLQGPWDLVVNGTSGEVWTTDELGNKVFKLNNPFGPLPWFEDWKVPLYISGPRGIELNMTGPGVIFAEFMENEIGSVSPLPRHSIENATVEVWHTPRYETKISPKAYYIRKEHHTTQATTTPTPSFTILDPVVEWTVPNLATFSSGPVEVEQDQGLIWYTEFASHEIGVLDRATDTTYEYPLSWWPGWSPGPYCLALDRANKTMWFTEKSVDRIARFKTEVPCPCADLYVEPDDIHVVCRAVHPDRREEIPLLTLTLSNRSDSRPIPDQRWDWCHLIYCPWFIDVTIHNSGCRNVTDAKVYICWHVPTTITDPPGPGWTCVEVSPVSVPSGSSTTVSVRFDDYNCWCCLPHSYSIYVMVEAPGDCDPTNNEARIDRISGAIFRDEVFKADLLLCNTLNETAPVELVVPKVPSGWSVSLNTTKATLGPGKCEPVGLEASPPEDCVPGSVAEFAILAYVNNTYAGAFACFVRVVEPSQIEIGAPEQATVGEQISVTAKIKPPRKDVAIWFLVIDPQGQAYLGPRPVVVPSDDGEEELSFTPDKPGTWRVLVAWCGDKIYAGASAEATIEVVEAPKPPPSMRTEYAIAGFVGCLALGGILGFVLRGRR